MSSRPEFAFDVVTPSVISSTQAPFVPSAASKSALNAELTKPKRATRTSHGSAYSVTNTSRPSRPFVSSLVRFLPQLALVSSEYLVQTGEWIHLNQRRDSIAQSIPSPIESPRKAPSQSTSSADSAITVQNLQGSQLIKLSLMPNSKSGKSGTWTPTPTRLRANF